MNSAQASANSTGAPDPRRRALWLVPPLLLGVLALLAFVRTAQEPVHEPGSEQRHLVSVIEAPAVDLVPRATGYGVARPGQVWQAVAQVGGRIVHVHPRLDAGELLPAGALLLRIDPSDYELRVAELQAAIEAGEARLAELDVRESNTTRSLDIERRSLAAARDELQRKRELLAKGSISRSAVDQELRAVLAQESAVQSLDNALALIPAERRRLQADLARERSRLAQARRDLEHTRIEAPFDCRVGAVNVELSQFVSPGQVLAAVDGIAVAEVPAQLSVDRFRALLAPGSFPRHLSPASMDELLAEQKLSAVVMLRTGQSTARWSGRVARISEALDPKTRTVGVVIAVDEPYARARPPEQPPLVKNMYVEVELRARVRPDTVVVPRESLHQGRVYVVDEHSRLAIRPVRVAMVQGDVVVIAEGVEAGDRVLVGDLVPAIEGMLLEPVANAQRRAALIAQAQGQDGA